MWREVLDGISGQTLRPNRLLIVDSASTDETTASARIAGFEIIDIKRSEFNHGGTRQLAAEYLSDCDVIIFMTQDAIPAGVTSFAALVASFADPSVAVAYGRQLAHRGATWLERHSRELNYGPSSVKKSAESTRELGPGVFFCSNSFAAYRRSVLLSVGGFKRDLILGEDMEFAARAITSGYANFYCADAAVFHSHGYNLRQTFKRYFDLGVFEVENSWMRNRFGSHSSKGFRFVLAELKYLLRHDPLQIPQSVLQTVAKLLGYRLGMIHDRLPLKLSKTLSMFPGYWR